MIESMGITRSSSNCESSEWGCSSTSKQPTLQHDNHMGWGTPRLCPVSRETWTGPVHIHQCSSRAPQATKHGQCQHQSAGSCSQAALPCQGKALCHLPGCWSWAEQGPGGMQCVRGEERGWTLHHLPDHRTSMPGCTHPSMGSSWAALGACWAQELFRQGPVWLSPAQPALPPSHHSLRDIREALK